MDYQNGIHCTIVSIGDRKLELNKVILRIIFLVLGFMAAFRGMDITNDTAAYYRTYQKIAYSGLAGETRMEIGYVALNMLLTRIFQDTLVGFHVLLFITSVFSYWALMAMEDLKGRKRYIVYVLLIVFATLFHKTAVVALVFPFLIKRKYTRNTTYWLMLVTLVATLTNIVSSVISILGLGTGYVTIEIGNAVNVGVVSLLYIVLLLLRLFCNNSSCIMNEGVTDIENAAYGDSFYTYCIALSLAVTVMSLRVAGMSRLNMYFQLIGLPYVSNILRRIED